MKCVVEPGEFEIMVGSSSRDGDLQKVVLTVEK
jgi:beta-glucosidase